MEELTVEVLDIEDKEELILEIMNRYGQDVLKLVFSYVNNWALAEDLTQDIFVKGMQGCMPLFLWTFYVILLTF